MAGAAGRTMGTHKPLILPWLVSQLDQGRLEGVAWLDKGRTRFRIPWKHGLRQDAQQKDFGIFQAWAEASGAYTPGRDNPDLPTWKRNFRSALNRKEVLRLVDDRSKDPQDPHKVYEFLTPAFRDLAQPDTSPDTGGRWSTCDTPKATVEELLSDMTLDPFLDGGPLSLALAPEHPPQLLLSPNLDIPGPCPNVEPAENPLRQLLVPEDAWEFEVTAFYRGRQVFQQTVFCPEGLRLVEPEAADGTLPGQPIRLPDPGVYLTDRDVMSLVKRVLSNLGGGLAIWRAGQQLWAQRLGHSHVYWAMGEELLPDSHGPSGEVPKDKEGGVFDLGPFVAGCSHVPQGPARDGADTGCLLNGEHCGPAHFQQPPPLPHLRPVQGLPRGPGGGHGYLGPWGGLALSSWMQAPHPRPQPINWFLPWSPLVCLVFSVPRPALTQGGHYSSLGPQFTHLCRPLTTQVLSA
nr:interferon regulatory factor 3 isoform X2 [Equus asinus]